MTPIQSRLTSQGFRSIIATIRKTILKAGIFMEFPKQLFLYCKVYPETYLINHLKQLPKARHCIIHSLSDCTTSHSLLASLSKEESLPSGLLITDTKENVPLSLFPTIGFGTNDLFGIPYVFETLDALDDDGITLAFCRFHKLPLTILETERLILKEWCPKDGIELKKLYDSFPSSDNLPSLPNTREELRQYLSDYQAGAYAFFGHGLWAVIEKKSNHIIGQCGIEYKERDKIGRYELQYMITPSSQRNGLAFEMCFAVLHYAKDVLYLDKISAFIEPCNTPSLSLIAQLGFQQSEMIIADQKSVIVYEKQLE